MIALLAQEAWRWWEAVTRWMPGHVGKLVRRVLISRALERCGPGLVVAEYVHLHRPRRISAGSRLWLGRYCQINAEAGVTFGDDVMLGPFVTVTSVNHGLRTGAAMRDQSLDGATVTIADDVWIGAHVSILPGVTVADGAVIGAGAVVTKDVPPRAIVGGVPARVIGHRAG